MATKKGKPSKGKLKKAKPQVKYTFYLYHYVYCLIIIALLLFTGINVNKYLQSQKVLGATINVSPLEEERSYWVDLIAQSPTYVDAYLQLAKVEIELGNKNEALTYIKKAYTLDPNSEKIIEVQKDLGL